MKSNNFPKNYLHFVTKSFSGIAVVAMLLTFAFSALGQRTLGRVALTSGGITKSVLLNESATLQQCRNGGPGIANRVPCNASGGGNAGWVTGNAGKSDSHWSETESLPYRMLFGGLTTGSTVHTVTIGYDILKNGVHAVDYLTSFDRTETTGADDGTHANQNNPCDGVAGFTCVATAPTSTFAITPDNLEVTNKFNADTNAPVPQVAGVFKMWGGNLLTFQYEPDTFGEERRVTLTFTANVANPVMAWGGHVAWQGEWGAGLSAGGISGSPYHMRLKDLDGAGGNQDRSLSADAVAIPAKVTIIKQVPFALSSSPTVSFSFNTSGAELAGFSLSPLTVSASQSSASQVFPLLTALTGAAADQRSVQESVNPPTGWHVIALGCFNGGPNGTASIVSVSTAAQISSGIAIATLAPKANDDITCTFTNSIVTAALAGITGRVATPDGLGIRGAVLTLSNVTSGTSMTAYTNSFGYYQFTNLPVDSFYVMNVSSRKYTFDTSTRSFTLNEDLAGLDFTSAP